MKCDIQLFAKRPVFFGWCDNTFMVYFGYSFQNVVEKSEVKKLGQMLPKEIGQNIRQIRDHGGDL